MIASIVAKENLVADEQAFLEMIRAEGAVPRIKPGGYTIHAPLSPQELLNTLMKYDGTQPAQ